MHHITCDLRTHISHCFEALIGPDLVGTTRPNERDRLTRSPMLTDVQPNRAERSSSLRRGDASHAAAAASCRHCRSRPPTNARCVRQRKCSGDVTGRAAAVDRVLSAILMAARRSERRPCPRSTPTRRKDSTTAAWRGAAKTTTMRRPWSTEPTRSVSGVDIRSAGAERENVSAR